MENPQLNIQSSLYTRERVQSPLAFAVYSIGFGSTATLAHHSTSTACLATQDPWVIDSSAIDHMTGTSGLLSDLEHSSSLPNVTLVDGSTTIVSGLGTTNLSPNLSLSSVLYIPDFLFNLLSISKLTKLLNCAAFFIHSLYLSRSQDEEDYWWRA